MKEKKNVSSINEHKVIKGTIKTPFNNSLGDSLKLQSWRKNRLPEYLWLALIINYYGRDTGLQKCMTVLGIMSKNLPSIQKPKLSLILRVDKAAQKKLYEQISQVIDKSILSPLTAVFKYSDYPVFNEYFFSSNYQIEARIAEINNCIRLYIPTHSNEATDLRYLVVYYLIIGDKLRFASEDMALIDAIKYYPICTHQDPRMNIYRSLIRACEGFDFIEADLNFIENFWNEIGSLSGCDPYYINYEIKGQQIMEKHLRILERNLEYITTKYKMISINNDKYEVLIGSFSYSIKLFKEIVEKSMTDSIHSRLSFRTIIEVFIMLKYLVLLEKQNPKVWSEYKLYGVSKYKLVLLKLRETNLKNNSHINEAILDCIVNEEKWEEFIDIDLKYFDNASIREKSIKVGEKELYDLYYDYNTNFAHGLWGAIRESSMLPCNTPSHRFHSVPDIGCNQELHEISFDLVLIMDKLQNLVSEQFERPEESSEGFKN